MSEKKRRFSLNSKQLESIVNSLDNLSDLSDCDDEENPLYGDNVYNYKKIMITY